LEFNIAAQVNRHDIFLVRDRRLAALVVSILSVVARDGGRVLSTNSGRGQAENR
jgi:hypothetical protein